MGHPTRLRVTLADRAGALAQVATVIGMHGGNIASIDVLSAGGDSAVDDLVVEFAGEPEFPELADDLLTDAGARLMSHQPAEVADPVEASLQLAASLGAASDPAGLAQALASLTWSTGFWLIGGTAEADAGPAGLPGSGPRSMDSGPTDGEIGAPASAQVLACCEQARNSGGPVAFVAHDLDHPAVGSDSCLLAVGVPGGGPETPVILLARSSPNEFTLTEQARVAAFVALYQHL